MLDLFRKFILNEITVIKSDNFVTFSNGDKIYRSIYLDFLNSKMYFKGSVPLCNAHAVNLGVNYYLSDTCCKYGHLPVRTVKGGKCYKCVEGKPKKHNSKIHYHSLTAKEVRKVCNQIIIDYPDIYINYDTAIKYGFTIYTVYKSCIHGHKPFRYVKTNRCIECVK